jgi:hypothetical protein
MKTDQKRLLSSMPQSRSISTGRDPLSGSHWLASRRIVPRSLLKSLVVCSRVLQHRSQAKTSLMIISSSRGSPAPGGASAGTFARLSLSILAKRK